MAAAALPFSIWFAHQITLLSTVPSSAQASSRYIWISQAAGAAFPPIQCRAIPVRFLCRRNSTMQANFLVMKVARPLNKRKHAEHNFAARVQHIFFEISVSSVLHKSRLQKEFPGLFYFLMAVESQCVLDSCANKFSPDISMRSADLPVTQKILNLQILSTSMAWVETGSAVDLKDLFTTQPHPLFLCAGLNSICLISIGLTDFAGGV